MHRGCVFVVLGLVVFAGDAYADVEPAGIFGDHMVLQRDMPVRVWGRADPGEEVTVRLAGRSARAVADEAGAWRVELPALEAGGPHELTVEGRNTITLRDVLVGEVWLCSGQSNMEWPVAASADAKAEIGAARDALIRHVKVPRRTAGTPRDDVAAAWEVCSPATAGRFTACGYYMARELRKALKVPIGLINASWGGTRIEPWITRAGLASVDSLVPIAEQAEAAAGRPPANPQQPTVLYNGMVHALVGYTLRGAVWYQGESNHRDGPLYTDKMQALIEGWREIWGLGPFPFHFVQIAPFRYGNEDPAILPTFWEAQAAVLTRVAATGMVVTHDVATVDDIHPPDKQSVGHRLALLALRRTYGREVVDTGPTFRSLTVEPGRLRVSFDHTAGRLRSRDRRALTHFEIAGADGVFVEAKARIDKDAVVLSARAAPEPLAMRFAWHKLAQPNLVNGAGLPAAAFRAGELPRPDFLEEIEEAEAYVLACDIDLADLSARPRYAIDRRAELSAPIARVAYLLELQPSRGDAQYLWVSMDPFTADLTKIAIPTVDAQAVFQVPVRGLTVRSNVEGVTTGTGLEGNIEFWSSNYGPANAAGVPNASPTTWDFGDQPSGAAQGYGSMQVHNPRAKETLFAINRWSAGGSGADIGIGSSTLDPRTTDWTFAGNGGSYRHKRLRVFVRMQ